MSAIPEQVRRRGGFLDGLMGVRRVFIANFLREARSRLGEGRFAYLRLIVTHLALIGIFYFMRRAIGAHSVLPVDLLTSLLVGFFPFLLCRTTMSGASNGLDSNRALLYYPGVRPLDFVFSFAALEGVTIVATCTIILAVNYQFNPVPQLHDPLETLMSLVAAWLLGGGVGLVLMCVQTLRPNLRVLIQVMNRPLLFTSGVMYAASEIPLPLAQLLSWNPIFHTTEMMREGVAASYRSPIYDPMYLLYWIMGSWAVGLAMERYLRRNIRS
ncbi:ABC transporter permease [Neomegalonema perideroedes]|uniref:ABC transporter permease n=1 Tax=Neomegalonema perideroedes TaxID=217219 RepID=UPI00037BFCBF|nr:ABC transporter permease [Neomegalonema perideroedes]